VTFDLDANGILNVTAMDQTTRARANITINAGVGHLSTEEIERMVASAEKMKAEDEATMARIEAKNALERTIYYARETAAQRDSASIREALEAAQAWLDESPEMEVKDYRRETVKLEKAMKCVVRRGVRARAQCTSTLPPLCPLALTHFAPLCAPFSLFSRPDDEDKKPRGRGGRR
jgi:molecular chaperone DnaK (HSP70)